MEFEEYESVKYWVKSLAGRAPGTKNLYLLTLRQFCEWLDKTPDQLVKEREQQLKSEDKKIQRTIEMDVKAYDAYLEDQETGAGTKALARAAIKSFFEHHYMPLKFIRGDFPWEPPKERRKVEKDEIVAMLNYADVRDRVLLHTLKDSGLSVSDASRLTMGDIFPETKISPITRSDIENLPDFVPITSRRKKTKARIRSFLGREAMDALKTYLVLRLRGTAHMYNTGSDKNERKGLLPEELTLDSPLFRTRHRQIEALSTKSIKNIVRRIAKKAGISGISAHSFRKYTQTMLEVARIDPNWRKQILGKKLPGTEEPYSQPTYELQKAYEEAYQHIQVLDQPLNEEERRIQATFDNLRLAGFSEDEIERYKKQRGQTWRTARELITIARQRAGRTETNGGSSDCAYKEIDEGDLLSHLQNGWRIVHANSNGKVIIQRG